MSNSIGTSCQFVPFYSEIWFSTRVLPWNPLVYCLIAAILSLAYWLVIELTFEVYFTFKRHDGLYFWSILISTWGIALRSIGWTIQCWVPSAEPYLWTTLMIIGLGAMVTGFSLVLYSRLHLVIRDRRILRIVLGVVAFDGVAFWLPLAVAQFGVISDKPQTFISLVLPAERLYVLGYFLQEVVLGCLYIWTAKGTVLHSYVARKHKATAILAGAQVFVILLDIPTLVLAWPSPSMGAGLQILGTTHPAIYAIKLKIELIVLNQLVEIVKQGTREIPERVAAEDWDARPDRRKSSISLARVKQLLSSRVQRARGSTMTTPEEP